MNCLTTTGIGPTRQHNMTSASMHGKRCLTVLEMVHSGIFWGKRENEPHDFRKRLRLDIELCMCGSTMCGSTMCGSTMYVYKLNRTINMK